MIPQRLRQIDVDPPARIRRPQKPNPLRIRPRREPARARHQVGQAIVLRLQRVRARIQHLTRDRHHPLQLEIGLLQHQHLIERLERDLRGAAAPERGTRRAHVVALPIALEQIGGIDRRAQRVGELALRAVRRQAGDLHVL